MPRRKGLLTVIRDIVQQQVQEAIHGLLASASPKRKAKNGRRRRRKAQGTGTTTGFEEQGVRRAARTLFAWRLDSRCLSSSWLSWDADQALNGSPVKASS